MFPSQRVNIRGVAESGLNDQEDLKRVAFSMPQVSCDTESHLSHTIHSSTSVICTEEI